ncbi:MAG: ATP-binding cassette domain-containing protein, partial [Vallitaleaceae bacterium]|nr:ATP-binding cassette domain-containing protein [Vallitaleaceae bacterium]
MNDTIIEVKNLHYSYPDGTKALQGVNMELKRGSKIAILGSNGAGKSTLLLHLNGTLKPKEGQVLFGGEVITYGKKQLDGLRKEVGIVFQDPDTQLFSASVYQDISFGPMNLKLPEAEVKQRVESAMTTTEVVAFKDKPTHALSYGQKKRVSIAGVLAMSPKVIILDEPTA